MNLTKQHSEINIKDSLIESILDNESITDGLTDGQAQRILHWCIEKIENFDSSDAQALTDYARCLIQQSRAIAKIVTHIQDEDDESQIHRRLQRLTSNPVKRQSFLDLLDKQLTPDECIETLLEMAGPCE